jgi:hypothetical protein
MGSGVMLKLDYDFYNSCHDSKQIFVMGFVVNNGISHLIIGFEALGMKMCYFA